jgi:ubiquinol-cytochrome c reductase cytochrome b subunit
MGAAVVLIAFLPWLDKSPIKSIRYRGPKFKIMLSLFIAAFIGLGILGTMPPTAVRTMFAQLFSAIYFAFFLGMPFYTKNDVGTEPVPSRVTDTTPQRQIRFAALVLVTVIAAAVFAKLV